MMGQMMAGELLISSLIVHAAQYHGSTEIVSVNTGGGIEITNWGQVEQNARGLAAALSKLGLDDQARCGTIAWNNRRHLEVYFGASGGGFVCHTINPRLHPDQLAYIVNHAEDQVLFIDRTFVPLVAAVRAHLTTVKHVVLMESEDQGASEAIDGLILFDDLIAGGPGDYSWPQISEQTASSLCYTSGTTGNPKGVLYSHRSTLLHTMACNTPDCLGLSARDVVLPVVPMFHVNAWGTPYVCAMTGAQMVLPGPGLDGPSLVNLIENHNVSVALGVPTIWLGLLNEAAKSGAKLDSLQRTVVGGSACPPSMMQTFRETYNVDTVHAWGMTEMSPLGSANIPLGKHADLPLEEQHKLRENQGRPPYGVELAIWDDEGTELPRDGDAQGNLMVRGPWILDSYFKMDAGSALNDGWFHTGDVATLDSDGYLSIKDRSKDIIKSGGEWISSVDLENIAVGHPKLANAAVIGLPHPKWDERPVLIAVTAEGVDPSEEELLSFFEGKIAKWQIPDRVLFVDDLPLGATGKVLKRNLRDQFADTLIK
ncbi:MAG: long-chain-fatty-acid--CoA ligase [Paracoccaceae bacterium]